MPSIVKHCKVILYADDTFLYYSSNSAREIEKYVNEDLHLICRWLDENLLTLNCTKSKFVLFGSSKRLKAFTNISIHVNDHELAREQTFKYLGITFSENLTWTDHLSNISTKINQRIGLLRRVKMFIPLKARLTIYNALILPLFDCADIVWGDKNNTSLMDQLQILQNKAAKTIFVACAQTVLRAVLVCENSHDFLSTADDATQIELINYFIVSDWLIVITGKTGFISNYLCIQNGGRQKLLKLQNFICKFIAYE